MDEQKIYTIKDLEDQGIANRVTQYRWREQGKISFYKIGTRVFYAPQHIQEFLVRHERQSQLDNPIKERQVQ